MRCGKGHDHPDVASVRRCYQVSDPFAGIPNADGAEDYRPSREVQDRRYQGRITDKQVSFLGNMLRAARAHLENVSQLDQISKAEAHRLIDGMLDYRRQVKAGGDPELPNGVVYDAGRMSADGNPEGYGDPQPQILRHDPDDVRRPANDPHVPDGYYATPSLTGNNDLDFWRVKHGRNPGVVFVNRVIGGHADQIIRRQAKKVRSERVARVTQEAALKAIIAYGVEKAGNLFADELKYCKRCGTHLTDELSRQRRIGPVCWGRG